MHIFLGFILIVTGLLTVTYFSGPKSNTEQANQPPFSSGQVQTLPTNPPTSNNFDYKGAKAAGYSDEEIQNYLDSKTQNKNTVTPKPQAKKASDKALQLSAYVFVVSNEKQRNDLISKFSNGTNDLKEAVKNLALLLDSKPEAIALIEKTIAQDAANKKSINDREAIGEYHQKEYERLKAEIDSLPSGTSYTYTGGTKNTANTPTKTESTQANTFQDNTQEINNRLKNIVNTPDVNKFSEPNIFNPSIANTYKEPIRYSTIGDTMYGSDGSKYSKIGDTIYKNDGTRYNTIGDTLYGSDGTRYNQIGDTVYKNDGTRYNTIGDTVYGSDGSKATSVGDSIYVQPGY